jgi:hypothetical protein
MFYVILGGVIVIPIVVLFILRYFEESWFAFYCKMLHRRNILVFVCEIDSVKLELPIDGAKFRNLVIEYYK